MRWSDKEIILLKKNYNKKPDKVKKLFPNRSWDSVRQKALDLGLNRPHLWKKEEVQFLKDNYYDNGIEFCSKKLNRSKQSIKRKVDSLKLKRNPNYNKFKNGSTTRANTRRDITNQKFGLLTAIEYLYSIKDRGTVWKCLCDCGNTKELPLGALTSGNTRSCGCLKNREIGARCYKGGKYITGQEFGGYKLSARRRNHKIDITLEDVETLYEKQNGKCALSNIPIVFNTTITNGGGKIINGNASIDRIDSSKDYTKDNIQLLDKDVNLAKQTLSQQGFIDMCCRVADHYRR